MAGPDLSRLWSWVVHGPFAADEPSGRLPALVVWWRLWVPIVILFGSMILTASLTGQSWEGAVGWSIGLYTGLVADSIAGRARSPPE